MTIDKKKIGRSFDAINKELSSINFEIIKGINNKVIPSDVLFLKDIMVSGSETFVIRISKIQDSWEKLSAKLKQNLGSI